MKILAGAITAQAKRGRLSLQVPTLAIGTSGNAPVTGDYPDDWFVTLRNGRAALGREDGYLYLTRAGYEANKQGLRAALESAFGEWEAFQTAAEKDLARREQLLRKEVEALTARLAEAQAILARGGW